MLPLIILFLQVVEGVDSKLILFIYLFLLFGKKSEKKKENFSISVVSSKSKLKIIDPFEDRCAAIFFFFF